MVDSFEVFRWHFQCWSGLIPIFKRKGCRKDIQYMIIIYGVLFHFLYSFYFQFHMTMGLLTQKNAHDVLSSLVYLLSSYMYTIKLFAIFLHENDIEEIVQISSHLDKQIGDCPEQIDNVKQFQKKCRVISAMYITSFGSSSFFAGENLLSN